MKIGVATPCHVDDTSLLCFCLQSVASLKPSAYLHLVDVNNGEHSLKTIRTNLFNALFDKGCDVVLSCDSDFWLFPKILEHVSLEHVVSFASLTPKLSDITLMMIRLFYPKSWSGLYSLPKHEWEHLKERWDGTDTSVKQLCFKHRFVKRPLYYALRPSRNKPDDFEDRSLFRKLLWLAKCSHAIRGN